MSNDQPFSAVQIVVAPIVVSNWGSFRVGGIGNGTLKTPAIRRPIHPKSKEQTDRKVNSRRNQPLVVPGLPRPVNFTKRLRLISHVRNFS